VELTADGLDSTDKRIPIGEINELLGELVAWAFVVNKNATF
jgi:hypothetical protein